MKKFIKIRRFEQASSFKLIYTELNPNGSYETYEREFKSARALAQYNARRECEYKYMEGKRLALIDGIWEPYTTIGKTSITLSSLEAKIGRMKEDYKTSNSKS